MRHLLWMVVPAIIACGDSSDQQKASTVESDELVVDLRDAGAHVEVIFKQDESLDDTGVFSAVDLDSDVDVVALIESSEPLEREESILFELRRGETLAHFSRWSGLTVEAIAESSSLSLGGLYPVGTEITLEGISERRSDIEESRNQHRVKRVEGYLASRGGASLSEFHIVQTGDTAWSIARDAQGIPVWLIEAYNPSINLDSLHPGQELLVPIITDSVADVGDENPL